MLALLRVSNIIDRCNEKIGQGVRWLVLVIVLISTANALARKFFDVGSNAFLEVQWYLFAAIFLLASGYTLLRNEHVRIDVFLHRFSKRTQSGVDIFGLIFFLFPATTLLIYLSWPLFVAAWHSGEMSENAGGLVRWPAYLLVPAGFSLLWLQGVSELIKRVAFLRGLALAPDPTERPQEKSSEEALAELIRNEAQSAPAPGARS